MYDCRKILFSDPGNITMRKGLLLKDETLIKIFSVVLAILVVFFVVGVFKCIDVFEIYPEEIDKVIEDGKLEEGKYVRVGVYATYDYYSDLVKYIELNDYTNTEFIEEKYYPIILDDGSIISLSVRGNENIGKMAEIYAATLEYIYDESGTKLLHTPVVMEGKLEKINEGTELRKYYDEFLKALFETYNDSEHHPNVYYFNIQANKYSSLEKWEAVFIVAGLGAAAIIVAFLIFKTVRNIKDAKQNEINNKNKINRLKKNNYLLQRDSMYKDEENEEDDDELSDESSDVQENTQDKECEDDSKEEFDYIQFKYTEKYNKSNDNRFF